MWGAAEFPPAEEGSAGYAAEFVEDLVNCKELIAGDAHMARLWIEGSPPIRSMSIRGWQAAMALRRVSG